MMVRARSEAVDAWRPSAHPLKTWMAAAACVNPAASSFATASGCSSGPSRPGPSRPGPSEGGRDVLLAFRDVEAGAVEVVDLRGHGLDPEHQLLRRVEPHEGGDVLQPLIGLRELLSLSVVDHLQAVLDAPQQEVRVAQGGRLARHDVVLAIERLQHREQAGTAQAAVAATVGELMHVDEELDLADAAAAELHVVAGRADGSVAVEVVNLLAHRTDFLDRGEVQRLVPDERRKPLQIRGAGRQVAGDGPGLDQRRPLPRATEALVVLQGEVDGDGDRGG